jgi:hypothetical protein
MAAKCAYVQKVGAVHYVRKQLPYAWSERLRGALFLKNWIVLSWRFPL